MKPKTYSLKGPELWSCRERGSLQIQVSCALQGYYTWRFMGSHKWSYRAPLRVSLKGSVEILVFRDSYKWSCKSPNIGYNYSDPT